MSFYYAIDKWSWALFIATTLIFALMFHKRFEENGPHNPEMKKDFQGIIRGFIIFANIPWIVMGIGLSFGKVPSIFSYFRPQERNLYVLAFFTSVLFVWIAGTNWLFLRNGAKKLVRYQEAFFLYHNSSKVFKVLWITIIIFSVLSLIMMFMIDMPSPK